MSERAFISVYKSPRREEMYLYMKRGASMDDLPEPLRQQFGKPVHVMDLLLTPERKLARTEAAKVLDSVRDKGFYLQMPPPPEEGSPNASPYLRSPESGAGH
jgi:uncharacterized protein YcgL (UPF0745 family)